MVKTYEMGVSNRQLILFIIVIIILSTLYMVEIPKIKREAKQICIKECEKQLKECREYSLKPSLTGFDVEYKCMNIYI